MFEAPNALKQICDRLFNFLCKYNLFYSRNNFSIIVPNIMMREEDDELFEDNPMDYIR